jgi:uncharacterized membrane protein YdjX (TVP38/TMEM64 family)
MDRSLADLLQAPQAPNRWTPLRFLPLGIVGLTAVATVLGGIQKQISFSGFLMSRDMIADYVANHYWAAIGSYFGVYVAVVALSIPGAAILSIIGGALFGAVPAGCLAITAATIGAVIFFSAARASLRTLLQRGIGAALNRFSIGFQRDAASYLLFLRLLPVFPFWLINLAAALFGVRYSTFVWTTMVGIIPGTFAFTSAGAGLDSIAAAQRAAYVHCLAKSHVRCVFEFNASTLMTRELLAAFVGLGVLALIPAVVRRCRPAMTHSPD